MTTAKEKETAKDKWGNPGQYPLYKERYLYSIFQLEHIPLGNLYRNVGGKMTFDQSFTNLPILLWVDQGYSYPTACYTYAGKSTEPPGVQNPDPPAPQTPDTTPPTCTFNIPDTATNTTTIPISSFEGTDTGSTQTPPIVAYYIAEWTWGGTSWVPPAAPTYTSGWYPTKPTSYVIKNMDHQTGQVYDGQSRLISYQVLKRLHAWVMDASGNISTGDVNDLVTITYTRPTGGDAWPPYSDPLPDPPAKTPPTVTAFVMPQTSPSMKCSVTTFTGSAWCGVKGYMITETMTPPDPADQRWVTPAPTYYVFSQSGERTVYAWVKDNLNVVSAAVSDIVQVDTSNTPVTTLMGLGGTGTFTFTGIPSFYFTWVPSGNYYSYGSFRKINSSWDKGETVRDMLSTLESGGEWWPGLSIGPGQGGASSALFCDEGRVVLYGSNVNVEAMKYMDVPGTSPKPETQNPSFDRVIDFGVPQIVPIDPPGFNGRVFYCSADNAVYMGSNKVLFTISHTVKVHHSIFVATNLITVPQLCKSSYPGWPQYRDVNAIIFNLDYPFVIGGPMVFEIPDGSSIALDGAGEAQVSATNACVWNGGTTAGMFRYTYNQMTEILDFQRDTVLAKLLTRGHKPMCADNVHTAGYTAKRPRWFSGGGMIVQVPDFWQPEYWWDGGFNHYTDTDWAMTDPEPRHVMRNNLWPIIEIEFQAVCEGTIPNAGEPYVKIDAIKSLWYKYATTIEPTYTAAEDHAEWDEYYYPGSRPYRGYAVHTHVAGGEPEFDEYYGSVWWSQTEGTEWPHSFYSCYPDQMFMRPSSDRETLWYGGLFGGYAAAAHMGMNEGRVKWLFPTQYGSAYSHFPIVRDFIDGKGRTTTPTGYTNSWKHPTIDLYRASIVSLGKPLSSSVITATMSGWASNSPGVEAIFNSVIITNWYGSVFEPGGDYSSWAVGSWTGYMADNTRYPNPYNPWNGTYPTTYGLVTESLKNIQTANLTYTWPTGYNGNAGTSPDQANFLSAVDAISVTVGIWSGDGGITWAEAQPVGGGNRASSAAIAGAYPYIGGGRGVFVAGNKLYEFFQGASTEMVVQGFDRSGKALVVQGKASEIIVGTHATAAQFLVMCTYTAAADYPGTQEQLCQSFSKSLIKTYGPPIQAVSEIKCWAAGNTTWTPGTITIGGAASNEITIANALPYDNTVVEVKYTVKTGTLYRMVLVSGFEATKECFDAGWIGDTYTAGSIRAFTFTGGAMDPIYVDDVELPLYTPPVEQSLAATGKSDIIFYGDIYCEHQVYVSGGLFPYGFEVVSGNLPDGMTLSRTGLVMGTPTSMGGFNCTVRVSDMRAATVDVVLAGTVV